MADEQGWFVNRRPTYILDTPCLTRQYILRPTSQMVKVGGKKLPLDPVDTLDRYRRKALKIDVMGELDKIADKLFPANKERFLRRETHNDAERFLDDEFPNKITGQNHDSLDTLRKLNAEISSKFIDKSRYQSLFFQPRDAHGNTQNHLEAIFDIHTEYISIQFRVYPHSRDFPIAIGYNPFTSLIRQKIDILEGKSKNLVDSDIEAEFISELISNHVFDALGIGKRCISELLKTTLAHNTRSYDGDFKPQSETTIDKKREAFIFNTYKSAVHNTDKTESKNDKNNNNGYDRFLEIKAIFNGCILRRSEIESNFRALRDKPDNDRQAYNSKVVADNFLNFHGLNRPGYTATKTRNRQPAASSKDITTAYSNILTSNLAFLQKQSFLFKKLLGFWPDGEDAKERYKDIHGGSAVMCGVLNGLGIYGCSFRPNSDEKNFTELRYFLLYAGPSRNQLSRLVRRLHFCGENRVMIGSDFTRFKNASLKLRNLGMEIDIKTIDPELDQRFLEKRRNDLKDIASTVKGGISYRVLQSKYYWDTLNNHMKDLRIERIVGWQTYDEFVRRIYEPQTRSYRRTGEQLEDVESKLNRAEEIIETRSANRLATFAGIFALISFIGIVGGMVANSVSPDFAPDKTSLPSWISFLRIPFESNSEASARLLDTHILTLLAALSATLIIILLSYRLIFRILTRVAKGVMAGLRSFSSWLFR